MSSFRTRLVAVLVLLTVSAGTLHAEWYKPTTWFQKNPKRVEVLLVTGNFVKSRVLAELIQKHLKQPILLLPSGEEGDALYFLLPNGETGAVAAEDYVKFVDFLNPKQVLFLGNKDYAPDNYLDDLGESVAVPVIVRDDDWNKIAFSAGELLKIKKLYYNYLVIMNQIDEQGNLIPVPVEQVFGGFITRGEAWPPGSGKAEEPDDDED
jgi:hypothetical protein